MVVVVPLSCSTSSSSLPSVVDSTAHAGIARKLESRETRGFPPPTQGQPTRWPEGMVVVVVAAVVAAEEEERRVTSTTFAAFARKLNPGGSPGFILRCKGSERGGRVVVW